MAAAHKLLRLLAVVLPQPLKHALFRRVLGWTLPPMPMSAPVHRRRCGDAWFGLAYLSLQHLRNIRTFELGRREIPAGAIVAAGAA